MDHSIDFPSPNSFLSSANNFQPEPATAHVAPSAQDKPKKKAVPRKRTHKPTNSEDADPAAPAKPKQTKSRNGCVTCKMKRLKCDEEKPACQNCVRRNVECGGYKKDFKWRPQFQDGITPLPKPPSPANGPSSATPLAPDGSRRDSKRSEPPSEYSTLTLPSRPAKAKKPAQPKEKRQPTSPLRESSSRASQRGIDESLALSTPSGSDGSPHHLDMLSSQQPFNLHSPTLTELFPDFPADNLSPPRPGFVNFSMPEDMSYPLTPATLDPQLARPQSNDFHDNDLDHNADMFNNNGLPLVLTSRRPVPNVSASPLVSNPLDWHQQQYGPDWGAWPGNSCHPQSGEEHEEPQNLEFKFIKYTCPILSIMDGTRENPWRSLIWPLAQRSEALFNALMAMTAFHASSDEIKFRELGQAHKQASIEFISEGIRNDSISNHMAIATAIALSFAESWDQQTATGNTHIKGAQALVKQALANHQRQPLTGVDLRRLKFLSNAYVYIDVLARLTSFDSDEKNDFDTFLFASNAPETVVDDEQGFGIDFGMPIDARLDPLMGCANTLFPLIGRVANLVRRVCRTKTNSPAIISQANDLKLALEAWDPPDFIETPEDRTTGIQHTLQTAEAYRWATILHLHQAVPEIPSPPIAELSNRVLQYLATVPLASRTVITHVMPLMIAGCEAAEAEDRTWVRERWKAMYLRTRLGSHTKCHDVTEEVWRRRDTYEARPSGLRRLVATSELHPSRRRSTPRERTDNGYADMDPGRTGIIFSYVEEAEPKHDKGPRRQEQHRRSPSRRSIQDHINRPMDPAYTPRGHLHWVGVMWEWGWEVLLG